MNSYYKDGHLLVFPIQKWEYFVNIKKIKGLRGGILKYVAQVIPQIDAEIGKIGHLWMETN